MTHDFKTDLLKMHPYLLIDHNIQKDDRTAWRVHRPSNSWDWVRIVNEAGNHITYLCEDTPAIQEMFADILELRNVLMLMYV